MLQDIPGCRDQGEEFAGVGGATAGRDAVSFVQAERSRRTPADTSKLKEFFHITGLFKR